MKKFNILKALFLLVLLPIGACEKNFLDVNTNPNASTTAKVDQVLPATLAYSAYVTGNFYFIIGGLWGEYVTQGPGSNQYNSLDAWSYTTTDFERIWIGLYAGVLRDLKFIEQEAVKTNNTNYVAIAKIWQAYNYQLLTDGYEDIPFSQALQGDQGVTTPSYDTQQSIYDGLIQLLNDGIAAIDTKASAIHPGNDDFIYKGNMGKWKKFANTLKLKIYLRQSGVRPAVAQAGIQKLYADGADFITNGDVAQMPFYDETFNKNPMYSTIVGLSAENLIASRTILDYMDLHGDTRIDAFYKPAANGAHRGLLQGEARAKSLTDANTSFSRPSDDVIGKTSPVVFISVEESYFLQAEAAVRGWGTGNPQTLYEQAITASFARWNLAGDEAGYIADPDIAFPTTGTSEDKIKAIITQKWVSMCCTQNFEAWTEYRRTGYPDFIVPSLSNKTGGLFPARLLYPSNDVLNNPNTPPLKPLTDRMWWDVN